MARIIVFCLVLGVALPGYTAPVSQQPSPGYMAPVPPGYAAPPGPQPNPGYTGAPPAYTAPAQQPNPFLIIQGASIGPVSIGMPLDEIQKLFGDVPSPDIAIPSFPRYIWTELPDRRLAGRLVVSAGFDARSVDAISVSFDTRYMTSTGIHIGDPSGSVRWTMGRPAAVVTGFYDADIWFYPGIAFIIGNSKSRQCSGRVCGIGVGRGFAEVF